MMLLGYIFRQKFQMPNVTRFDCIIRLDTNLLKLYLQHLDYATLLYQQFNLDFIGRTFIV